MAHSGPEDIIFESENFTVERSPRPFVSREEGGNIRIFPKNKSKISERRDLSPSEAMELMRLTMVVGEAMEKAMNERGIKVVKINYHDMGNWAFKRKERPVLHIHIFGRAENAKHQEFPEAVYLPARESGFYDKFKPLNEKDMVLIRKYIEEIFKENKYDDKNWLI